MAGAPWHHLWTESPPLTGKRVINLSDIWHAYRSAYWTWYVQSTEWNMMSSTRNEPSKYGPDEDHSILQCFSPRNSLVFNRAIFRLRVLVLDVTFHSVFGHVMSNVLNNTYARYHSYTRHTGIPVRTHNRRTSTPKQHRPLYGRWRQWHGHLTWASVLMARCHCLWRSRPRVVLSWLTLGAV